MFPPTVQLRYVFIDDITEDLVARPLALEDVEEAMADLETNDPLAERIAACILGVPNDTHGD